jgi:hypothetical protein
MVVERKIETFLGYRAPFADFAGLCDDPKLRFIGKKDLPINGWMPAGCILHPPRIHPFTHSYAPRAHRQ